MFKPKLFVSYLKRKKKKILLLLLAFTTILLFASDLFSNQIEIPEEKIIDSGIIQRQRRNLIKETCAKLKDIGDDPKNGVRKHPNWDFEIQHLSQRSNSINTVRLDPLNIIDKLSINYCQ